MAFTAVTLNPGTGGDDVATQTYSSKKYQAVIPVWGPDGGAFNLTDTPTGLPVQVVAGSKATYGASVTGLVPVASATDIFEISGSATTTVKINKLTISGVAGTAVTVSVLLIKRSTANSSGTSSTATNVPYRASNAAATAVVKSYTANPTTGSAVGTLAARKLHLPLTTTAAAPVLTFDFAANGGQPIVLTAAAQMLCVNLGGVSVSSGVIDIDVEWTEE